MPLFAFEGREPQVSPGAWIAPTATLVGDVRVEAEASVWYGAVLRADFGPIVVRRGANIQDGSVLHGGDDPVTEIGEGATVGHLCVVHGAVIGTEALVGNGATVLDGVVVGRRALIAAGATVPPGMAVPDGMIAVGVPARVAGEDRWIAIEDVGRYRDGVGVAPPTGSKRCSSSTRKTFACMRGLMSPTSSRKSVAPSASSNLPRFGCVAPVNAPRAWPKSSDSINSSGTAEQFNSTKGAAARRDRAWMARATSSLPVPDSP